MVVSATPSLPRGARVAVGGVGGGLLVADAHEPDRRFAERAPEREVVHAGQAEGHLDARASSAAHRGSRACQHAVRMESSQRTSPVRAACGRARRGPLARARGPLLHDGAGRPRRRRDQGRAPEGGDETRSWGPPFAGGEAAYYLSVNRGKRSCALDLADPEGRALALELCARADVVVENFKHGGAEQLGVGYEQVRARNPGVVYCSISGFGSEREPAGRAGLRLRRPGRERPDVDHRARRTGSPFKVGVALVDVLTGLHAAIGDPGGAARRRGRPRSRCRCSTARLAGLVNVAQSALVTGREPGRFGNAHPNIVPYQDFETASGRIAVAAANDGLFRRALPRARPRGARRRRRALPPTPPASSTARR